MPSTALSRAGARVVESGPGGQDLALAQGPQHGYGIIQDVGRISGERVALRAGTLYGALERLDADGLIAMDREEVVDGRPRRYYRADRRGAPASRRRTGACRRARPPACSAWAHSAPAWRGVRRW